jgi:hypothetical protein
MAYSGRFQKVGSGDVALNAASHEHCVPKVALEDG